MKRNILKYLLIFIFFLGIALLLYPAVSDYVNSRNQSTVIQSYQDAVENIGDDEKERMIKQAEEYNKRLAQTAGAFYDPDLVEGYMETLDITGTGIMGYLNIDKIDLELPVYHTVGRDVLQVAVGHLPGTSLPVGGKGTHTVLSGHRGLPSAKLFTDLDKLEPGHLFCITIMSDVLTYQVDQVKTVKPYEIDDLKIDPDKDYCTLFTCTPYGINSHRLLVRGVRVETKEEYKVYVANDVFIVSPFIVAPIIAAPILLVLLIILMVKGRKKK